MASVVPVHTRYAQKEFMAGHQRGAEDAPDAALYIAAMADELAALAKRHDLEALAYILQMARLEADQISKHSSGQLQRARSVR